MADGWRTVGRGLRRPALSTAARVAVVAGLIGVLLAGGFAYWLRDEVYTARYQAADQQAQEDLRQLTRNVTKAEDFALPPTDGRAFPAWEIVDSGGWIISQWEDLLAYRGNGPIFPPPPRGLVDSEPFTIRAVFGPYEESLGVCGPGSLLPDSCAESRRLAGQEIKAWRMVRPLGDYYPAGGVAADRNVAFSVAVLPFEAEDAVAEIDRVLRPALPAAVLLIMVGAYFGTRAALRPVERIRAQAAEIGERNLHERVPVPPTRDVVAKLASTLNDTLGRLESAADRQRGFVADAAHELRSPIAGLRATLEVANEHPDRADWQQVVRTAADETRRLQELADDLLLVARLDAEHGTSQVTVDLAELVRRHLARRLDGDGYVLELELGTVEEAPVLGNEQQLDRLLRNLVDNATQHAAGHIVVRVELTPAEVVLHVDDDGPGIRAADRERVFERFTRLDESRSRDAGGIGLGLAIAREIAVRHGGTLTIDESPAGGARATLVLSRSE